MTQTEELNEWTRYFEDRSTLEPNSGCILWLLRVDDGGYGWACFHNTGETRAHRVSWVLANGPIPKRMKVLHKCDVPSCVNPDHLWLGTQIENIADMMKKGRNGPPQPRYGSDNNQAVLEGDDVWAIRYVMLPCRVVSQNQIARDYGVSPMTISRSANNQTWPHINQAWPL